VADFAYVPCPACKQQFMVGEEFFRIPEAYCHCPFCAHEFKVYRGPSPIAAAEAAASGPA